jgi:hypothetical protein
VILSSRSLQAPVPAVMPPAGEYHDPVWLVQRAWSSYRLPRLQAVIRRVITELQALAPGDVLGKNWSVPELASRLPDPLSEALRACSEELREASGIAGSQIALTAQCNLVRRYVSQQPAPWEKTFGAALDGYRHAACAALLLALQPEAIRT